MLAPTAAAAGGGVADMMGGVGYNGADLPALLAVGTQQMTAVSGGGGGLTESVLQMLSPYNDAGRAP
jgi:hypothetical protein